MELKGIGLVLLLVGYASAQTYKVCVSAYSPNQCQSLETGSSQVSCQSVQTRVDCALKLARGEADIGYFSEEEVLLLAQQQPSDHRLVATVRDVNRMEPFAFEAVAVVPRGHSGGLAGLRGGAYCHPGLDEADQRWSPRVLKALEVAAAQTDRCGSADSAGKSADGVEVETLAQFFSAACRPGPWSANETQDAALKSSNPSLCSLCGSSCAGYSLDMNVNVAGVSNDNRHVQALECLRQRGAANGTAAPAVAYVAWLHVRQYFTIRNAADASSFSLLCPDGSLQALSPEVLNNATSPCAFVRQPWGGVVASTASATAVLSSLRSWWPQGASAASGPAWQAALFQALANGGGANARLVYESAPVSLATYTQSIRSVPSVESSGCIPARRWCVLSAAELAKCSWLRAAAHQLGLQPAIACQQRATIIDCLRDIREGRADLISSPSNYGYLARRQFKLTTVKMVQNQLAAQTRVVALVKQSAALANITRFENLRGGRACFPEYGGLAYVAFVRAAQERGVVPAAECDYARALGDFFSGACAPGAQDAQHALSESDYDAKSLCSVCRPASGVVVNEMNPICTWDYSNQYFGNNGSLACLADPSTDVAVLNTQNIAAHLSSLNLAASSFRALCRNNSLAAAPGLALDDNCALAHVVDAEVVTRRDDPLWASLNVLLDALEQQFGTNAAGGAQLLNLELFSPFDGTSDLLFKDSTIGLTEPSSASPHAAASNYFELFRHLDACSAAPAPAPALAAASGRALLSLLLASALAKIVFN